MGSTTVVGRRDCGGNQPVVSRVHKHYFAEVSVGLAGLSVAFLMAAVRNPTDRAVVSRLTSTQMPLPPRAATSKGKAASQLQAPIICHQMCHRKVPTHRRSRSLVVDHRHSPATWRDSDVNTHVAVRGYQLASGCRHGAHPQAARSDAVPASRRRRGGHHPHALSDVARTRQAQKAPT